MPSVLIGKNDMNAENPIFLFDYLAKVSELKGKAYVLVYERTGEKEEVNVFAASSKKSIDAHFGCDVEDSVKLTEKGIIPIRLFKEVTIGKYKNYREATVI